MPKHFEKENYMGEIAIWYITIYLTSCSFFFPDMVRHQSLRCQKDDQISTAEETFFLLLLIIISGDTGNDSAWDCNVCNTKDHFAVLELIFVSSYSFIFNVFFFFLQEWSPWMSEENGAHYISPYFSCVIFVYHWFISPFLSIHFISHFVLIIVFFSVSLFVNCILSWL